MPDSLNLLSCGGFSCHPVKPTSVSAKCFLLLLAVVVWFSACQSGTKRKAGICISFDDRSIYEWQTFSGLLDRYNAKVTFFVTQFDSLNEQEIEILKDFKRKGHEIGCHGALHVISENYITEHGYAKYLQNEVELVLHPWPAMI